MLIRDDALLGGAHLHHRDEVAHELGANDRVRHAYVAPSVQATGDLITAAIWNQNVVNDVIYLASKASLGTSLTNPAGITSGTLVAVGFGGTAKLTPGASGKVSVLFCGDLSNSVGGDNNFYQVAFGTGTAPSNGTAATGTVVPLIKASPSGNGERVPFVVNVIVSSLSVGTQYWFDLAADVSGGTLTFENCAVTLIEL